MAQETPPNDEKYNLRSVGRALDVLQVLGNSQGKGMSVAQIAEAIGVSRSTAFTLLQTLVARRFVADVRSGGGRLYGLGLSLVYLGDLALQELGVSKVASPVLHRVTEEMQLTSRLAILDDGFAVAIGRVDAPGPFRIAASLGRRELPHCSSVGKALLASKSADDVRALMARLGMPKRTDYTLVTPEALLRDLAETRARGYSFDNEEDNLGVACIGAGIFDRSGDVVAAISVSCMKLDRTEADMHAMGAKMRAYADEISTLLGGPTHATSLRTPARPAGS